MHAKGPSTGLASGPDNVSWLWFDYNDVPASVAKFLKGQADRIRRTAGKSIVEMGKDLVAAKHYLAHGAFLRWVVSEVGIPARTAQAYMQVAHWASSKSENIVLLPPTLLYLLSSPSTPEDFIADVLRRTEAGERMSLPDIREELRALRDRSTDATREPRRSGADRGSRSLATHVDGKPSIADAVALLARSLSPSDFERIRDIMTSRSVLNDHDLARTIEMAFHNIEPTDAVEDSEVVGCGDRSFPL